MTESYGLITILPGRKKCVTHINDLVHLVPGNPTTILHFRTHEEPQKTKSFRQSWLFQQPRFKRDRPLLICHVSHLPYTVRPSMAHTRLDLSSVFRAADSASSAACNWYLSVAEFNVSVQDLLTGQSAPHASSASLHAPSGGPRRTTATRRHGGWSRAARTAGRTRRRPGQGQGSPRRPAPAPTSAGCLFWPAGRSHDVPLLPLPAP